MIIIIITINNNVLFNVAELRSSGLCYHSTRFANYTLIVQSYTKLVAIQ